MADGLPTMPARSGGALTWRFQHHHFPQKTGHRKTMGDLETPQEYAKRIIASLPSMSADALGECYNEVDHKRQANAVSVADHKSLKKALVHVIEALRDGATPQPVDVAAVFDRGNPAARCQ